MDGFGELRGHRRVLAALGRGALGERYDTEIPDRMLGLIEQVASSAERKQLLAVLKAIDSRAGGLVVSGRPVAASWLTQRESEALLRRWQSSTIEGVRFLARAVIRLAVFSAYAYPGALWDRIGYPGPLGPPPQEPKRLPPLAVDGDEEIDCDVVVVGSGAGGGCAAAVLAARGCDVILLEKGAYYNEADFDHVEAHATRSLYLYGKTLSTRDMGVHVLAGSCVGGGTVVNYATSFRLPAQNREEWARDSGVDAFVSGELDDSYAEVGERLGVNTDSSAAGKRDQILEQGLKKLGWHVDNMPRAVRGCAQDEGCGYCGFGCRLGAKQSTLRSYLEDAAAHGARLIAGADVRKVVVADGRAAGVEATVGEHRLVVRARAVVAAAGAIETPALLLRSGLRGQVGRHLRLHPATAAWGLFDEEVRVWEGTTQARYSFEMRAHHGAYGPMFETVPVHPGEWASAMPWTSAAEHAGVMDDYARASFVGVLPRDASEGRVRVHRDGSPWITYALGEDDQMRLVDGLIAAARILEAAGARRIHSPHSTPIVYEPNGPSSHERWADDVRRMGLDTSNTTFVSYHQMGSCRMGADPSKSAIDANNESHDVRGLYVVDASAFPTASGVNPMLTVYAIAHRAAHKIAERLE